MVQYGFTWSSPVNCYWLGSLVWSAVAHGLAKLLGISPSHTASGCPKIARKSVLGPATYWQPSPPRRNLWGAVGGGDGDGYIYPSELSGERQNRNMIYQQMQETGTESEQVNQLFAGLLSHVITLAKRDWGDRKVGRGGGLAALAVQDEGERRGMVWFAFFALVRLWIYPAGELFSLSLCWLALFF